jgi:WD40 repeat protein
MTSIHPESPDFNRHKPLDFKSDDDDQDFGIWSIRLSADASEIVAGGSSGLILLYDIEQAKVLHHVQVCNEIIIAPVSFRLGIPWIRYTNHHVLVIM